MGRWHIYRELLSLKKNSKGVKGDPFLNIKFDPPSCLISSNPRNNEIDSQINRPNILVLVDDLKWKTNSDVSWKHDKTTYFRNFNLFDQHSSDSIVANPDKYTEIYAPRDERSNDVHAIAKKIGGALLNYENSLQFDHIKQIIYEGEVITIGGLLKYSIDKDSLYFSKVEVITTGGEQNLLQYFKEWKNIYSTGFKIGLAITAVFVGVGVFYLMKHKRTRDDEKKRLEFERGRGQAENLPEDELCTICYSCRRDVIILPCGHLVM
mmetsp:Transcript_10043/g.8841  ORF Transcript_10043/g.8841 Transcript_10043/m.8841 type:complete len:265 (-) Transcript_10043:47-841(-)